jgi:hypothetical protein
LHGDLVGVQRIECGVAQLDAIGFHLILHSLCFGLDLDRMRPVLRRILLRLGGDANAYGLLPGFLFGGNESDLLFPFRDRHFTGRLNPFLGLGGEGAGFVGQLFRI